jgi:uncharacterized membrane protein YphA (DoxX/SURF4 family)
LNTIDIKLYKIDENIKLKCMKTLKVISRYTLGIVFTISGLSKALDPHGSEYIFNDYFTDAFGMPSLTSLSLVLAIVLAAFEFLVGICLLANVKPRLSAIGALIFMVIFTPLTLYSAIASPVKDCGCFGEVIKLEPWPTFFKNLILLPLAIFLFSKTKGENTTYKGKLDWLLSGIFMLVILFFEYYNLAHLPVYDVLPFSVGTYIPDKMIIPSTERPDSFAIFYTMKHKKTGKTMKVDDGEYINKEIWKDSLWEITETSEPVLVKKGYEPPIYNFKAYPVNAYEPGVESQVDAMKTILEDSSYSFLVISYDFDKANMKGFQKMGDLLNYASSQNIKTHFLTSTTGGIRKLMRFISFPATFYNSDPTTLKMVIRSNPGLVLLKKGKIIGKWHYNDIPSVKEFDIIIKQK